jgi:shikimate dehydrogenase
LTLSSQSGALGLADLRTGGPAGTALAVLGWPVRHSLSPLMHHAALAHLANQEPKFAAWRYDKIEIRPEELGEALALLQERGFRGINLTVPHKIIALDLIGDIAPAAKRAGAVNTLLAKDGAWHGYNTDGYGLHMAVREAFGRGIGGRHILLLGAGGAARGAAVECLAQGCLSLTIANRTAARCEELLGLLRPLAGNIPLYRLDPDDPTSAGRLPAATLVINATSAGLQPGDAPPITLATLPRPEAVYDMIYNPPVTPLLREAAALGLPRAHGLGMLVHQGAKALEIWTGASAALTAPVMAAALRAAACAP